MPRTVPSQIDHYLSSHLKELRSFTVAELHPKVGVIAGFLDLYRDMPDQLINLPANDQATLVAEIANIKLAMDRYRGGKQHDELAPISHALPRVWAVIRKLPDSFPSTRADLSLITDADLQKMIGSDIDAVGVDLQSGEWKGATVLAGSCSEALLLYAIQEWERRNPNVISQAVKALHWKGKPPKPNDPTDRSWDLFCYTAVAHKMKLISDATKNELDTARDYRNLIHPAKAIRQKVACDRGTAYVSVGAMDHVVRDLKKNL